MNNLKIKRATLQDVDSVASLFDLYRQFYEQSENYGLAREFIFNRISKNESVIFTTAEDDGNIIGLCQLYPTFCSVIAEPILVLYDLFVIEPKRKLGAGRALLLAAEEYAKSIGIKRMDLTTAKDNFSAQSLYESLGWKKDNVFLTYTKKT